LHDAAAVHVADERAAVVGPLQDHDPTAQLREAHRLARRVLGDEGRRGRADIDRMGV